METPAGLLVRGHGGPGGGIGAGGGPGVPSGSRGILRRPGCGRRRSESLRARVFIIPAKPLETDAFIVITEDSPEAGIAAKVLARHPK